MIKKIGIILFIAQLFYVCNANAQRESIYSPEGNRSFKNYMPVNLIDTPTANILVAPSRRNNSFDKYFQISLRVYGEGGMIGSIKAALTRKLMFGISYGGQNLVGSEELQWNPNPGVHIRYKLFSEGYLLPPAIAFGYDTQGFGGYNDTLNRYTIKSPGFYIVASNNLGIGRRSQSYNSREFMMNVGIHGGINFSQENIEKVGQDLNMFFGAHISLEEELAFLWEYDLGLNDNKENSLGSGKGYMNAAIQWLFMNRFIVEFSFKDLLKNRTDGEGNVKSHSTRELKIIYHQLL